MKRLLLSIPLLTSITFANCDYDISDLINRFNSLSLQEIENIKDSCNADEFEVLYDLKNAYLNKDETDFQRAKSLIDENGLNGFNSLVSMIGKRFIKHRRSVKVISADEIKKGYIHQKVATRGGESRGAKLERVGKLSGLPINFETGKYEIKKGVNKEQVDELAKALKSAYKDKLIYLTGFTDTRGEHNYNLNLSKQRAYSVKNYLIMEYNFSDSQIKTDGFGESAPICIDGVVDKNSSNEYFCRGKEDLRAGRRVVVEVQ